MQIITLRIWSLSKKFTFKRSADLFKTWISLSHRPAILSLSLSRVWWISKASSFIQHFYRTKVKNNQSLNRRSKMHAKNNTFSSFNRRRKNNFNRPASGNRENTKKDTEEKFGGKLEENPRLNCWFLVSKASIQTVREFSQFYGAWTIRTNLL